MYRLINLSNFINKSQDKLYIPEANSSLIRYTKLMCGSDMDIHH